MAVLSLSLSAAERSLADIYLETGIVTFFDSRALTYLSCCFTTLISLFHCHGRRQITLKEV